MTRKRTPTTAEIELWRTVVRDARPLFRTRRGAPRPTVTAEEATIPVVAPAPPPPSPKTATRPPAVRPTVELPVRARTAVSVDLAPSALGNRGGIDKRTDERVRKGRLPVDRRIDLHGMTQSVAHDALLAAVRQGHDRGQRLVLVITGKGGLGTERGVLRGAVPRWLNEAAFRPFVLAVHQAQPQHGGDGALYVFLRRRRGE